MSARLEFGSMNTTLSEADRVGRRIGCMSAALSEADRVGLEFGCMSAALSCLRLTELS